jgi:lipopolysaccharide transport system ATP-binding protein
MSTVIKVENLSKIYRLGQIGTGTITQDIERWFKTKVLSKEDPFLRIGESNDRAKKGNVDIVYSLKDINFAVNQGDAVGIIGRNGAGKSTLLKILSRVTTPTTGKINIKGRVASLLEVGTGFHPELTGRENIYLNGAILGMRKREIDRKLDEIIDFSGVERYIDTPVKRYSSGMYVRLAFAVAAHLESEILIVDEVLAVGDAEFQKKCLGKMGEVSKGEGRTVLFVSHNLDSIQKLCQNSILIENGEVKSFLATDLILKSYSNLRKSNWNNDNLVEIKDRIGNQLFIFSSIKINGSFRHDVFALTNSPLNVEIQIIKNSNVNILKNVRLSLQINNFNGPLLLLDSQFTEGDLINVSSKESYFFQIENLPLSKGEYSITLFLESNNEVIDWIENVVYFSVLDAPFYNSKVNYPPGWGGKTVLYPHKFIKLESE